MTININNYSFRPVDAGQVVSHSTGEETNTIVSYAGKNTSQEWGVASIRSVASEGVR